MGAPERRSLNFFVERSKQDSKYALQLNYILLLTQYHTWQGKLEEKPPNFTLVSCITCCKIKTYCNEFETTGGGGGGGVDTENEFLLQIVFKSLFPVPLTAKIIASNLCEMESPKIL